MTDHTTVSKKYNVPDWSTEPLVLPALKPLPSQWNPFYFLRLKYVQYKINTAIYMMEPWEEIVLNLLALFILYIFVAGTIAMAEFTGLI
ncbi:hypothetical protein DIPPA_17512 [Diplonema papillatum]|nr:hypothetical protein DIPPA_17512 [Diplonema papillatum]